MAEYRKLKRAIIKEELVSLTGDFKQAVVLNQFIYWSERVKDSKRFMEEEIERSRKFADGSVENAEDISESLTNGWIWKTAEEMVDEVMLTVSKTTMQRIIDSLVDKDWLNRRRNPKYHWDKTYQYRVNLNKIQTDLFTLGFSLEGYSLQEESNKQPKVQNESSMVQNEPAIPEITTETTSELKKLDTKDNIDTKKNLSSSNHESERQRKRQEYMDKAYRENTVKIPGEISEVLNVFCDTEQQRNEYYKVMIIALNNAANAMDRRLSFKTEFTLATHMAEAFVRAIRKIEKDKSVSNPSGYIFQSVFQTVMENYKQDLEPNMEKLEDAKFYNWLEDRN